MESQSGHVINLANSIIGVSILAMPYCFKQCGILLSITILLISSIISRLACHFLLKSAILARRKTFELLALHIFGSVGKLAIEIGIIGFLLGTCIVLFVVMGDLMPDIISEMSGAKVTNTLRNGILVSLAVFCVLPLGLLRNVSSLNGVSKATIGFYCCLVLKIVIEALPHLIRGDWFNDVILWEPAGILRCLPIFSMALFCQTQLFEIYQDLPNASLDKMNNLIRVAVNICTMVYIFVGTFGYIAFCKVPFTGNILLSFQPSTVASLMKFGFVLSLAFSFPLVIFPCRASLYSLIYKETYYTTFHEGTTINYIPEGKFKMLTLLIVFSSLGIGIMIPTIETVLGLVGSTIGVMICVLFPVTCFICISQKNTNERILAQIMLFIGVIVMVLGTYANLYAFEETTKISLPPASDNNNNHKIAEMIHIEPILPNPPVQPYKNDDKIPTIDILKSKEIAEEKKTIEQHNVNEESQPQVEKLNMETDKLKIILEIKENEEKKLKNENDDKLKENSLEVPAEQQPIKEKQEPVVEPVFPKDEPNQKVVEAVTQKVEKVPALQILPNNKNLAVEKSDNKLENENKKTDELDIKAIKKEETELKEQEEEKQKEKDSHQLLIDTLQKQNEVQQEIVKQQKRLIEVFEKQQGKEKKDETDKKVNEEKLKAVQQIEKIARKAIESISGQDKKNLSQVQVDEAVKIDLNANLNIVKTPDIKKLEAEEESKPKQEPLIPIPLILAKTTNNNIKSDLNNNQLTTPRSETNVGRDILAEKLSREKREISNNEGNMKTVCNQKDKITTEKPIIKMLCNLSVPNVVNIDTGVVEKQKDLPVDRISVRKTDAG